ncbi:MAG: 1-acyl-sn-glycerol-3-phosphate acyltransferase [Bacteroidales bacterium]|nr:1-acyl-sn-glycerol-3-phosphate acyltransferase [Bacteroidales bacterium]
MNEDSNIQRVREINVRKVFAEKNAKLARIIPGFVFRYLEKVVHQKDINDFLAVHGNKTGIEFVKAAIEDFNVSVHIKGEQNIPREGRYIFAANHPWGGFDGLLLMELMSRYYSEFKYLVNDILMNITNLHSIFIPINKHGKQASEAVKELDATYRSSAQIVTFPSGFVSRFINGQVMDLVWKKNFISKAVQYQRDVVPVYFNGSNSKFFYRLYRFRRLLGIKANLEMFYLVDETYKHRNKSITVTFGRPIPYITFDKSRSPKEWAKWVKERVYELGDVTDVPL